MRIPAVVMLVAAACTGPGPSVNTPTPSPEPGVLKVTALLDLSGPRAAVGAAQRNAMELWLERRGEPGRTGPEVRVSYVDLEGSDSRLFIELRRAAEESDADAVVVGVPAGYTDTVGRAIDLVARPVLFTLPLDVVEPVTHPGGRWAFALAPPVLRVVAATINDASDRGVLTPALVLTGPGPEPDPWAVAIAQELERRGRDPFTQLALPADGSVPAVVRSSLSVLRSAHCTAPAASCAAVARAASEILAPTFFYLPYATTPGDLEDALAARAVWPASRTIGRSAGAPGPDAARARFLLDHEERFGPATSHAATAYDALTLLATAAANGGTDDAEVARTALERINMPLIASTYTFEPARHSGTHPEDLGMVSWTGQAVTGALPPFRGTGIPTPTPSASPLPSPSPSP